MRIPPDIVAGLLGFFMGAQARGWIDVKSLEPLLRTAVERGYGPNVRQIIGQVTQLLEQIETGTSTVRPSR
jgi:hypothetical protein